MRHFQQDSAAARSRRQFLWEVGGGLGGVALASLLAAKEPVSNNPLASKKSQFAAKATNVIQIFCPGGLSHVDTWDYKPELERRHGEAFDAELGKQTFAGVG